MKTQIIHLDENDDLISTQDKLSWVKMSRVILVIPPEGEIFREPLELVRLRRHVTGIGKEFAIVTKRKDIKSLCSVLQIPNFANILDAQKYHEWNSKGLRKELINPNPHRNTHQIKDKTQQISDQKSISLIIRSFLVGFIIISIILAGLFTIPSATISIKREIKVQEISVPLITSEDAVPTGYIYISSEEITLPLNDSFVIPTSGTMTIADMYATGIIRFENLTENMVGIPTGTIVMTSEEPAKKYVTQEDAEIPPGIGKHATVPVRAVEAGSQNNIEKEKVSVIEGIYGSMVSVRNPTAINGGTEKQVQAATTEDRQILETAVLQQLKETCNSEIMKTRDSGDIFLPGSESLIVNQRRYFPDETQPADFIAIMMDVECIGRYVKNDVLLEVTKSVLDRNLPPGFRPAGEITRSEIPKIIKSEDSYTWTVTVERLVETDINQDKIIQHIMGKNRYKAIQFINSSLALDSSTEIIMSPSWWINLPLLAWRIQLEVNE